MNTIDYVIQKNGETFETLEYLQQQAQYHKNQYESICLRINLLAATLANRVRIHDGSDGA